MRTSRRTDRERVVAEAGGPAACEDVIELALEVREEGRVARRADFRGRPAWIKGGPVHGKSQVRHALRRLLLRRQLPRVSEYRNLEWLRARLFRTPEPLAAAAVTRRGLPAYQLLVTALVPDARPLAAALAAASPEVRTEHVDELARETARMHALYFIHHDLFVRNVLATPPATTGADTRRLVFLDTWRGGPFHRGRGPAYDLACLMLEGAEAFTPFEQRLLFERYVEERATQGRPVDERALLPRTARERSRLLAAVEREPGRWRSPTPPNREWSWRDALG